MGRLASERIYTGFANERQCVLKMDSGSLKLRLCHFVPFLDASMHLDVSDSSGHVPVQSALSVWAQKACQSKHVHVSFHDGLSACHDVCVPTYRFMELGGQSGTCLSDSVLHAGHAKTSHVSGLGHALKVVSHDLSHMPLVVWTCTRRFGGSRLQKLQNLMCAIQTTNHILVRCC
eukprot:6491240-Amphidinium_carterae.2